MSRLFGPVRQIGVVVKDFQKALKHWTEVQGVGPFFYFTDTPVSDYRYNGQPTEAAIVSIAFSYMGDTQIEIVHQQNDATSCWKDFLATGREGVQHVSGFCDGKEAFDARYKLIRASGRSSITEGSIGGVRFAYFNTETPGGIVCEISESDMDGPRQLFDGIRAAAQTWDGADPIRPLVTS